MYRASILGGHVDGVGFEQIGLGELEPLGVILPPHAG